MVLDLHGHFSRKALLQIQNRQKPCVIKQSWYLEKSVSKEYILSTHLPHMGQLKENSIDHFYVLTSSTLRSSHVVLQKDEGTSNAPETNWFQY